MSSRSDALLIEDMLEGATKIQTYTEGMSMTEFQAEEKTVDAVIRNFEIIGEASGRLSEEFKMNNSNIDWQRLRGFRNRIVHEYFGIDRPTLADKGAIPPRAYFSPQKSLSHPRARNKVFTRCMQSK
jgi:uncharacterized protein with HEPN domain